MDQKHKDEVLKRGYAETMEEWWLLLNHHWADVESIISRFTPKNVGAAKKAREEKTPISLYRLLNIAWDKAPDSPWIHSIPSWGIFCDLCSEFPH